MNDEVFEVDVEVVKAATERALLCVIEDEEVWIPRSQIVEGDIEEKGDTGSVVITAWLAEQRGWL